MGPVNWLAVILAANFAAALRIVWNGPLANRTILMPREAILGEPRRRTNWLGLILALGIGAAMLGHMFARLSPGKPWLFFMMSGGVALTFIVPALWVAYGRREVPGRETAWEASYWVVAYLAMGAVFWALG